METQELKAQLTAFINQVAATVIPMFVDSLVKEPPPEDDDEPDAPNFKLPEFENCVVAYGLPDVGNKLDIIAPLGDGWKLSSLETAPERGCVYGFWIRMKPDLEAAKTDAPPAATDEEEASN